MLELVELLVVSVVLELVELLVVSVVLELVELLVVSVVLGVVLLILTFTSPSSNLELLSPVKEIFFTN